MNSGPGAAPSGPGRAPAPTPSVGAGVKSACGGAGVPAGGGAEPRRGSRRWPGRRPRAADARGRRRRLPRVARPGSGAGPRLRPGGGVHRDPVGRGGVVDRRAGSAAGVLGRGFRPRGRGRFLRRHRLGRRLRRRRPRHAHPFALCPGVRRGRGRSAGSGLGARRLLRPGRGGFDGHGDRRLVELRPPLRRPRPACSAPRPAARAGPLPSAPQARPSTPQAPSSGTPTRLPCAPAFGGGADARRVAGLALVGCSGRGAAGSTGAGTGGSSSFGAPARRSSAARRRATGRERRPGGSRRARGSGAGVAGRTPARARPNGRPNANGRTRSPPPPAARAGTNDADVAAASPSPWAEGRRPRRQTSAQGRRAALTCS